MKEVVPVLLVDLLKRSNVTGNQLFDTPDPATLAPIIAGIQDFQAVQYGTWAAFVLVVYDYSLTVSDEVELFWKKMDFRITSVLYLLVSSLELLNWLFES
jgi:hypothetical protein